MVRKKLCLMTIILCLSLAFSAFAAQAEANEIYLNQCDGSDDFDGTTFEQAVQTFQRAKELLSENGTIWLIGPYTITGSETWSLADKGNAMVKRYRYAKDNNGNLLEEVNINNLIKLEKGATLTLDHIVIDGSKEQWKEGEMHNNALIAGFDNGKLILNEGAVLQNNNASYMGAAVSGWNGFELVMNEGSVIQDNECHGHEYGGGVFVSEGVFTMNGGRISNNRANRGGGVAIIAGTFNMNGGTVEGNSTYKNGEQPGYGGGLYIADYEGFSGAPASYSSGNAYFNMKGGSIQNNKAQHYGGGILTFPQKGQKVTLNISGGSIKNNETQESGGGIGMFFQDTVLNMTGGEISNNKAARYGGGLFQYNTVDSTMNGGTISNNSASFGGGVHLAYVSRLMLYKGDIFQNTAEFGGGVEVDENSLFYMNGGTVNQNTAENFGGGVDIGVNSGRFHMIDGEIQGNKALNDGSSAGVNVGNIFELGGTARIDPDNDVFLLSSIDKHIDMISPYTGTTGAQPIQITSNRDAVEGNVIGTKLVYYTSKAGGAKAAEQADKDGIFAPSKYMKDGLAIGQSRYENDWMTYVPSVQITYKWAGKTAPSDVVPPERDVIRAGRKYTAKEQKPSAENYVFKGWFTDETCQKPFVNGTPIEQNMTLYGVWTKQEPLTPITAKYTFLPGENGSITKPNEFTLNVNTTMQENGMSVPTVTVNGQYQFTGWKGDDGKLYTADEIVKIAADTNRTFTAQYEKMPAVDLPQTGDETPLMMLLALMLVSGVIGITMMKKHTDA